MRRHILFVLNLLQDVNVIRPLAYLAAAELDVDIGFLVTDAFVARDRGARWMPEVHIMAADLDAGVHVFGAVATALAVLADRQGVLVAGSESDLLAHAPVHELFRAAPPGFLRITLQHGFECVGFLQNAEQTAMHGGAVRFAADVLCGWLDGARLTAMAASERPKLYVTGPQTVLQMPPPLPIGAPPSGSGGIVCENLHSVRFGVAPGRTDHFLREFDAYAERLAREDRRVTIRPHPGGQYVVRNGIRLPANVLIENQPMFRIALTGYDFGISAPSTVLLDMLLAGLPTAVWRDPDGLIDRSHYAGLPSVGGVGEWLAFDRAARADPAGFRRRQAAFLADLGMPTDAGDIRARFARLLAGAGLPVRVQGPAVARPMVVADANDEAFRATVATPLRELRRAGGAEFALLTGDYLAGHFVDPAGEEARHWSVALLDEAMPTVLLLDRYSGPLGDALIAAARAAGAATAYRLADDPARLPLRTTAADAGPDERDAAAVRRYLAAVDRVVAETPELAEAARALGARCVEVRPLVPPRPVVAAPALRRATVVGYAETDGGEDLAAIAAPLARFLDEWPLATLDLLVRAPLPPALLACEDRIRLADPPADAAALARHALATGWSVALCPAVDGSNPRRTVGRWRDYAAAGIPAIVADVPCARALPADAVLLAGDAAAWGATLARLAGDPAAGFAVALAAQAAMAATDGPDAAVRAIAALIATPEPARAAA